MSRIAQPWRVSRGTRSVDCPVGRIRVDASHPDGVPELMGLIASLPHLEAVTRSADRTIEAILYRYRSDPEFRALMQGTEELERCLATARELWLGEYEDEAAFRARLARDETDGGAS